MNISTPQDACSPQAPDATPGVLAVDNDAGTMVALRALLEPLDCRVVCAQSGIEAISRTREETFAAIVMDIRMPGLDGYAAASFIRQHARSVSTPILFYSGDDIDVAYLTRQYGNTGQVDSLQKPFDPEVFRSKLRGWLDLFRKQQHVHELEHAVDAAQAQARSKDDILAMVAHDLRGPLGVVKMSVAAMRRQLAIGVDESKSRESLRHQLDLADRTIDRMTRLVADLVDSVRIESTGLPLEVETHPIAEIIAQAIDLLCPLAEQKNVVLSTSRIGPSCSVRCDRDRILQVLSNLLGNAVKFTPPGGRIHVESTCSDDEVEICVRDTGPGIAPDQIPHIFDKYWQGNNRAVRKGLGLGLAIAKEIVLAHGGRIWVDSQLGEGSQFFFCIPRSV
jgi:signal transduction histidine kinase